LSLLPEENIQGHTQMLVVMFVFGVKKEMPRVILKLVKNDAVIFLKFDLFVGSPLETKVPSFSEFD
jgi:hypothetical protein